MKILILSVTFPYPPTRGGTQVRTFNLLKYLSHNHSITLVTQRASDVSDAEIEALRECVKELAVFPRPSEPPPGKFSKLKRLQDFFQQGTPPNVKAVFSEAMQQWVDRAVAEGAFDAIACEHSVNEIYIRPEWKSTCGTVVNIHSSVYGSCKNQLETKTSENQLRDKINLPLLRQYEKRYTSKFRHLVVTTVEDKRTLLEINPESTISVIANGVDLALFPKRTEDPGGYQLVFIGAMDNIANIDAARFLSLEVFPQVQNRYPEASLMLVGARPVPEVSSLGEQPGITVTGRVPSMVDYLHRSTVCVIPMRTGFGIKNKTLEAMAAGIPVVASDRGLEGLAVDGPEIPQRALRANTLEDYVVNISRLFENPALRKKLSRNGRDLIEQEYTWEQAGMRYEQALIAATQG
ncbi:glycosyltransferase family 4 protein [Roseofilum sp. Guam]|uniref:glycosyltransferase family 4 protein n=1 Tax=Roseofilum sp. Guam TaxID=2821502 RepID=UPI001B28B978|nr:glycosyltransferase family 4 protein [Roseofilum sp. Guam]MBP0029252.1 glycosyltransferase [Roseofilum sp. Guam]